ncbi:MAG: PQQ-binding-like beta-propeller repeat protein [Verrucomicrobia bacterium]|nr:PQQ-binding-like beta-propeller repeat protein [Verrucomicrobiota bacterium]MDA1066399.1 PQQ-binding-like beta-propeller repeat protein [Verrucomicrobiota bacterium]
MKLLSSFLFGFLPLCILAQQGSGYRDWGTAGGDTGITRYSSLDQVNTTNVSQLEVAWTYRSGDAQGRSTIQCNPIVVDGVLYATTPNLDLVALDASTGVERWRFSDSGEVEKGPDTNQGQYFGLNRGVAYWKDGDDRRILYSRGHHILAVKADTGKLISSFGEDGRVDMRYGLSKPPQFVGIANPAAGVIYKDLFIVGSRGNTAGHVRAYNVRSGNMEWIFNTIPHPGERFEDTWPEGAWAKVYGANVWSGLSVDVENGLVFCSTSSPKPDLFGWQYPGKNDLANSVVALNAATGEYVWHFQEIKHGIWDLDLPAPPMLVTVERDGLQVDAVAQVSKTGNTYLLDRLTGRSLFPLVERPAPASDISIEQAWPTQTVPLLPPPFTRQEVTYDQLTTLSPEARADAVEQFIESRSGWFMPISPKGTILYGVLGGAEWPGAAFDPNSDLLYVAGNNLPLIIRLDPVTGKAAKGAVAFGATCTMCHAIERLSGAARRYEPEALADLLKAGRGIMPSFAHLGDKVIADLVDFLLIDPQEENKEPVDPDFVPQDYTFSGFNKFVDKEGYPAVKPPWGVLSAIDLNRGEIVWQTPIGEYEELTRRGIPATGTPLFGGPTVTAGGLVFIGGSTDEKFRALDSETGEILWETKLPFGAYANPSIYEIDGRQYVVIASGGGGKNGTPSGDAYVAFALPESTH